MKVLTLMNPWATLVSIGAKQIETRGWRSDSTGLLLIHASKKSGEAHMLCYEEPFKSAIRSAGMTIGEVGLSNGRVIAVCNLRSCEVIDEHNTPGEPERSFGDYARGRYMWHLTDVQRIWSEPVRGKQNIWNLKAIPMVLLCPVCNFRHVDADEWAEKK
jgi:hypothetical protein